MNIRESIIKKLNSEYSVHELTVNNESSQHNVPAGSESHFYIFMVTDFFKGMPKVRRHQAVFKTLDHEMKNGIHALRMQLHSIDEVDQKENARKEAPKCLGGS